MKIRHQAFEPGKKMLKGALHCHTTRSDGDFSPEELLRIYYEHGYDFVAITDHKIYNYKNYAPDLPITVIPGFEFENVFETENGFRQFHTVCLGPEKEKGNLYEQDQVIPAGTAKNQEEYQKYLDEIHANGNITFYCHPEYSGTPSRYFEKMQGDFAFEIYNSGCHTYCDMDTDANYWEELLGQGKKIFGVATDDCHMKYEMCKAWVMVNADNNVDSILDALKRGAFYSSTGPEIHDLYVEGDEIIVETSPVAKIRCVADNNRFRNIYPGGDKNQPGTITRGAFEFEDHKQYSRVSVIDRNGKYAWANPIFYDEVREKLNK